MDDAQSKQARLEAVIEMQPVKHGILVDRSTAQIGDKLLVFGFGVVQVIGHFNDMLEYPRKDTLARGLLRRIEKYLKKSR